MSAFFHGEGARAQGNTPRVAKIMLPMLAVLFTLAGDIGSVRARSDQRFSEGPSHEASRRKPAALTFSASHQPNQFSVSPSALQRGDDHLPAISGKPSQARAIDSGSSPVRGAGLCMRPGVASPSIRRCPGAATVAAEPVEVWPYPIGDRGESAAYSAVEQRQLTRLITSEVGGSSPPRATTYRFGRAA
jgi:hypothetical protein